MIGVIVIRVVALALFTMLTVGSVWAETTGALWPGLFAIAREPWGAVTFCDLGSGLTMAALFVAWREPRRWLVPLWIVLLLLFGNMATLAFVLRCTIGARNVDDIVRGPRSA
jgi:hypothetical protein